MPRLALSIVSVLILAACSAGTTTTPPTSGPASAAPSTAGSGVRIAVKLIDALKMEPSQMSVPVGQPVTFVVTNAGTADHEFFVGDEAAQGAHEMEMSSMGGMGMGQDEPNGIGLKPGETKELKMTFAAAGSMIAGCHITGHYPAGMKATITIGP